LLIGLVTSATGQQRPGLVVVFLFLIIGAALMSFVREKETGGPVPGSVAAERATPL
jgi:MFS-type transporter involved in bile tolerance (Atg22 family)